MSFRGEGLATWMLAIAAAAVVTMMARDRFGAPSARIPETSVIKIDNWEKALGVGLAISTRTSHTKVIEFLDLECPFCAGYDSTMLQVERELADSVQFYVVHMPIPGHKFARGGARAIECAGVQGRAREFISHVYVHQDSIGLKSWVHLAQEAGVKDTTSFNACTRSLEVANRVDSAATIARELKIPGTPTILIDGWRFSAGQSAAELLRSVRAIRRGGKPI